MSLCMATCKSSYCRALFKGIEKCQAKYHVTSGIPVSDKWYVSGAGTRGPLAGPLLQLIQLSQMAPGIEAPHSWDGAMPRPT